MKNNNRLTSRWTETLEEAFGPSGLQGTKAENMACILFGELGIRYKYEPSDEEIQNSGIDIIIHQNGKQYGVDVKGNLHSKKTVVAVEWSKLIKSSSVFWLHINVSDRNDFIMYKVADMIEYIEKHNIPTVGKDSLCWVNQKAARQL